MHSWWIERLEGWLYFHDPEEGEKIEGTYPGTIRLWFDGDALVGAVHPRSTPGTAHIQIHPEHRHLEPEMIDWAEKHLAGPSEEGATALSIWAYEHDGRRQGLLESLGFEKTGMYVNQRWRSLVAPIPYAEPPEGYTIRPLSEEGDADLLAHALNAAFGRTVHTGEGYRNLRTAPTYREDLDLVAIAPDGSVAAFATAWHHPDNAVGAFEPVGTHPGHRRRGLARGVVCEGMRRLRGLGAIRATVGTGMDPVANEFYESLGFTECNRSLEWRKRYG